MTREVKKANIISFFSQNISMDSEILLSFSWINFQESRECVCTRSRNSAVSTTNIACGLYNPKHDVDEANTTMTYLATSSLPGLSIFSTPSLLPVAGKRKYSRKRVYVAVAVAYSVWVSFAITARNSSSRLDWVVSSSLSLHILIRPCESPVASVWRLETKKQKINRGISTLMVVFHSMEALGTGCNFSQTSQWPL